MSSLSGKQVGEIKNLYESIYTEETVDETVEVSYDEYSDEELLGLFVEEVASEVLATLYENDCLSENYVISEGKGFFGIDLLTPLSKLTGYGRGVRRATKAEFKAGVRGPQRNTYPDKTDVRGRVTPGGVVGNTRRRITDMVLGGLTTQLAGTPLGQSLMNRLGGAVQGAGKGFMQDPKPETKTKPDDSWLDNYRTN
jgi:hypothetical protein